jgi:SAM-dependent methyltransferase
MKSIVNLRSAPSLRQAVKRYVPDVFLSMRREYLLFKMRKRFRNLSAQEAFTAIYAEALWGKSDTQTDAFCSGSGSCGPHIVSAYITALRLFLESLDSKPRVVDLGCGDFSVGSRIRAFCGSYIACDVVEALIERNRERYKSLEVEFRVLDLTTDQLPDGDVVFIRQVFQHLSNDLISRALPAISSRYKYLVLTEHLPLGDFIPNVDKATGPDIRLLYGSGVVLTRQPFNLSAKRTEVLCEVRDDRSIIQTLLYEF